MRARAPELGALAATLLAAACADPAPKTAADGAPSRPVPVTTTPAAGPAASATTAARRAEVPHTRDDTRFIQIRNLLEKDPESEERARKLYPLVEPVCTSEKERADFVDVARWSSSFSVGHDTLPTVLALDTIEHVATACARSSMPAAHDLLARAKAAVPDPYRYELISARLLATEGRLAEALAAAKAAAQAGSVHALALSANIEAQLAREKGVGYTPGMLDGAIATVSAEPNERWALIDLTAVLSSRAHLLGERAIWEAPEAARATLKEALKTHERLTVAPFIEATRTQALDSGCFISAELAEPASPLCRRAADEAAILGGVVLSGAPRDGKRLDLARLAKLEALAKDLGALSKGDTVLVATRGDESELVTWVRPAARVLARIARSGAKVVVLDRTRTPRAGALVKRTLDLAGVKPVELIRPENGGGTLAMPCLAAIAAGRRTPSSCPFDEALEGRLVKLPPTKLAVLIGRDLDAELDDLKLYGLRAVLLSFRQTRIEKGVDTWLKSLSDAWVVAPAEDPAR